jgi:peptidoglycan/xylan/chitin deacetylase (PgdA/CDA1 family)
MRSNLVLRVGIFGVLLAGLVAGSASGAEIAGGAADPSPAGRWSRMPPAGRRPADVPQFVAITFDDNFGLAAPGSVGGVKTIVDFYKGKHNAAGPGGEAAGGAPITTTFFGTSVYIVDSANNVLAKILNGHRGEDRGGRNLAAWKSALTAGHEMADHTVNHFNGGAVGTSREDCCRPRNWSVAEWTEEIAACRTMLTDPRFGLGARDVLGFRAPYLSFNDNLFTALQHLGFAYDSSVPNCFADEEDGINCSWPHLLDQGSPDADVLTRKLEHMRPPIALPTIARHAGLWELPVTTLIVPPDSAAGSYGFARGLRARVAARAPLRYPSLYEASTGKITGLDYTLLIDAGLTGGEMRAVLAYNLDLHLAGNRSPLIFVAHAHLYAYSGADDNPDTPSDAERAARWKGLAAFIDYALTKPEVRIVGTGSVLAWMRGALAGTR